MVYFVKINVLFENKNKPKTVTFLIVPEHERQNVSNSLLNIFQCILLEYPEIINKLFVQLMTQPGAPDLVRVICLMHDTRHN